MHFLEKSLELRWGQKVCQKDYRLCTCVCAFVKVNIQLCLSWRNVCNLSMSCRKFRCQSKSRVKSTALAMHRWRLTIPLLPLLLIPPLPLASPLSGILCQRVSELLLLITSTFICGNQRFVQTYFPLDRCHQTAYSQFKGNTWRTHTHRYNHKQQILTHTQSWT